MRNKSNYFFRVLMLLSMILIPQHMLAQTHEIKSDEKRIALKGYDPVSYFTDNKPEQGSKDYSAEYDDTTYWFKNADHRDKFAANPDKYAPQFDGYCAIALSKGKKVEADPLAWSIKNGKLFVFFGAPGVPLFKKEGGAVVKKAKTNWPKVKNG